MIKRIGAVTVLAGMLVGCSNGTFDKAMEQGKLALANGEYDKALSSIELALDEKPDEQEAISMKVDLIAFRLMKKDMKTGDWESALKQAEALLQKEELAIGLRQKVEEQIDTVKVNLETSAKVVAHLADIEKSVKAGEMKEARTTIEELQKGQETQMVMDKFSEQLASLEKRLETEVRKQQATVVTPNKSAVIQQDVILTASDKQQQYRIKLDAIERGLADLNYLYVNGVTVDMKEAESERYRRWDVALNEIYSLLKKQLSANDMNQLREKQREWIKYRDQSAGTNAAEFEGGTFESLTYISTQAELTKERCYELVNHYMN